MKELPVRKINRLPNYNYSQNGAYFLTICTKDRLNLFGEIIVVGAIHESPEMQHNEYGKIVVEQIGTLPMRYPGSEITMFCVMPNHVHLIVTLNDTRAIRESPPRCH